jgi:hypothetical protein
VDSVPGGCDQQEVMSHAGSCGGRKNAVGDAVDERVPRNETVENLGVITPHFETDDVPNALRQHDLC